MTADEHLTSVDAQGGLGLLGRYRLIAKLGHGGMADVFLAIAQGPGAFNKLVVIKRLRSVIAQDAHHVRMFVDEAKLSARLSHPNVVQTYEVGSAQGSYFIVMEYLDGQSLKRIVKGVARGEPGTDAFTRGTWVRIIIDMLGGLHHAHELCDFDGSPLGIIHRDVSPHNVFVTYDGAVKIVDFGVAKAALNATHTETGVFKGKVAYMAPEQATASKTIDRRADVFAAGIVLWELLSRQRLFEGDYLSVMHRLVIEGIPRLSVVVSGIPDALDQIVAKALEREPVDRYASAREMGEALEGYLRWSGEDVRAPHLGAMMLGAFEESRARMRQQIRTQLDRSGSFSEDMKEVTRSAVTGGSGHTVFPTGSGSGLPLFGDQSQSGASGRGQAAGDPVTLRVATVPASLLKRGYLVGILSVAGLIAAVAVGVAIAARPQAEQASATLETTGADDTPKVGVLIASDPTDATVSWKGQLLGRTPVKAYLPIGTQVVVVSRSDFVDETLMISVSPSEVIERSVTLRPKDVTLPSRRPAPASPGSKTR